MTLREIETGKADMVVGENVGGRQRDSQTKRTKQLI